ncbi:MAG: DUF3098 domain-containing protein [Candidatus Kapaibacteriales bacterium]
MAKPTAQKRRREISGSKKKTIHWKFPLEKQNFIWFAVGLGVVTLGYLLMMTGITEEPAIPDGKWNNFFVVELAPILLFIGYCIIIPYSLLKKFNKKSTNE